MRATYITKQPGLPLGDAGRIPNHGRSKNRQAGGAAFVTSCEEEHMQEAARVVLACALLLVSAATGRRVLYRHTYSVHR